MEYTLIKVNELLTKTKEEVGSTADIMVLINNIYYKTKSNTFLLNVIDDLTTGGTTDAASAQQLVVLKALIDWQNYAEGFIFDYTANWTLTPSGTDVDVVIPTCDILAPNSSTPVERTGTSGTITENGGLVLVFSDPTYSYVFVDDLTDPLYADGIENTWVIVKNVGGNLYSRNTSMYKFISPDLTDLTDGGATTLHKHDHDNMDGKDIAATGVTYGHVAEALFKLINKTPQTLTSSAAISMDIEDGLNRNLSLAHDATLTFSNLVAGAEGNIDVINTGTYTLAISPTPYVINDGAGAIILTDNGVTVLSYYYTGTYLRITYGSKYTNA